MHFNTLPASRYTDIRQKSEQGNQPVWPDWAIYCFLGNFLKHLATFILPKSPTLLGNFCKGVKIFILLLKSFLGNFYRHFHTATNLSYPSANR